jgi:hypothetical protein
LVEKRADLARFGLSISVQEQRKVSRQTGYVRSEQPTHSGAGPAYWRWPSGPARADGTHGMAYSHLQELAPEGTERLGQPTSVNLWYL